MNKEHSYKGVPVEAARSVGQLFDKNMVVILAYDRVHEKTHTTTWGRTPEDKLGVARLGDICAEACGADMSKTEVYQDFRAISAGEQAQKIDKLVRACRAAKHAISSIMVVRDGMTDEELGDVRAAIIKAVEKA